MTPSLQRLLDNPIAYKEGISRMRTWRAPLAVSIYLALIGGLGLIAYILATSNALHQSGAQVGGAVFATMAFTQLALICVFAPGMAAGAVSGERERQTLDMLLVTRLTALEIALGKLVASLAFAFLLLLAALPVFAAVFVLGGVGLDQFLAAEAITLVTAALLAALSLLWSTIFRRTLGATVTSYLSVFGLLAGTAVLATIATAFQAIGYASNSTPSTAIGVKGAVAPTVVQPSQPPIPWEWDLNPFYGLYNALFGNPPLVVGSHPPAWPVTIVIELVVAALCFLLAVRTLRGRLPRRGVR